MILPLVPSDTVEISQWYTNIYRRIGVWKHLTNPLYILVVLFLSILLLPSELLSVIWYPRVYYITNQNASLGNECYLKNEFFSNSKIAPLDS